MKSMYRDVSSNIDQFDIEKKEYALRHLAPTLISCGQFDRLAELMSNVSYVGYKIWAKKTRSIIDDIDLLAATNSPFLHVTQHLRSVLLRYGYILDVCKYKRVHSNSL